MVCKGRWIKERRRTTTRTKAKMRTLGQPRMQTSKEIHGKEKMRWITSANSQGTSLNLWSRRAWGLGQGPPNLASTKDQLKPRLRIWSSLSSSFSCTIMPDSQYQRQSCLESLDEPGCQVQEGSTGQDGIIGNYGLLWPLNYFLIQNSSPYIMRYKVSFLNISQYTQLL